MPFITVTKIFLEELLQKVSALRSSSFLCRLWVSLAAGLIMLLVFGIFRRWVPSYKLRLVRLHQSNQCTFKLHRIRPRQISFLLVTSCC